MSLTRFKLSHLGLAAVAAFSMSAASAAPIAAWDYEVSSVFATGGDGPAPTFTGTNGSTNVTTSQIDWGRTGGIVGVGAGTNRSALQITRSPEDGTMITNGGIQDANIYTHVNNTNLNADSKILATATILATLKLKPAGAPAYGPGATTDYAINFKETTNNPAGGVCPVGAPPCADIFVLTGNFVRTFVQDFYQYTVTFSSVPALGPLGLAACAAAQPIGTDPDCIGYVTEEDKITPISFGLRITSQFVPEPASIALLGAGLLGLAGIRRRQQKNKA